MQECHRLLCVGLGTINALHSIYPHIRFVSEDEDLFLCPPGRQVLPPAGGCPIRDDGIIASFHGLRSVEDGFVVTEASVAQSSDDGRATWWEGFELRLGRNDNGTWDVVKVGIAWRS